MKHLFILLAPLLCLTTLARSEHLKLLPDRIDKAAQERVTAKMYPALVIGIVDGDKSAVTAYGKLPDGKTPDADTVFEIGSVTKTFTATLLADAIQSGRLKLDAPIAELLPDFEIPARSGKQITLLDIATQHSGLPRMQADYKPADPVNPYAGYDAAQMKSFLAGYELTRDPGASYEYSNLAVGLLGYALAESEKTTYAQLVREKIFVPLGMTMSGIAFSDTMRVHLAPPTSQEGEPVKNWDLAALAGAGGIRSTAADMLRYLKANMGLTQTTLDPAMKLALEPRRDVYKNTRIGLIWMTRSNPDEGGTVIWHTGMTGGYSTFLGFTPDGRHGVIILTNINTSLDDLGFATLLPNVKLAPTHKTITLPTAALDQYAGTYKLSEQMMLNINRGGNHLVIQANGQEPYQLFASAPDEFFETSLGITLSFIRDGNGTIAGLVLHQDGDHAAPKLTAAGSPDEPKATASDPVTRKD
jgi:D-alanyl-D-alanine-carboxypeptidase/D-alanyl-D-alanine-endopeptidase